MTLADLPWGTTLTAIGAAATAWAAAAYKFSRVVKFDNRADKTQMFAETAYKKIIDQLEAELARKDVDLHLSRELRAKLEIALMNAEETIHILMRKYAGRDPRVTDIGTGRF